MSMSIGDGVLKAGSASAKWRIESGNGSVSIKKAILGNTNTFSSQLNVSFDLMWETSLQLVVPFIAEVEY